MTNTVTATHILRPTFMSAFIDRQLQFTYTDEMKKEVPIT